MAAERESARGEVWWGLVAVRKESSRAYLGAAEHIQCEMQTTAVSVRTMRRSRMAAWSSCIARRTPPFSVAACSAV